MSFDKKFAKFGRLIFKRWYAEQEVTGVVGDISLDDLVEYAVESNLLECATFDPDVHGDDWAACQPGETIYLFVRDDSEE